MIELRTGLPGSSKTLNAIAHYKKVSERDNRPIYYYGIKDLVLPWIPLEDPHKWFDLEPNAIVIIDEAQKVFRPSSVSAGVPEYIARMEDHRHGGIDLVLITQQPMLLHKNCREMVGHHLHYVRMFGMQRSTVHEWDECRDNPRVNRKDSRRSVVSFPREAYQWYKSAEAHTHKRNIPGRVWFLLAAPFIAGGLAYYGWGKIESARDVSAHVPGAGGVVPQSLPGPAGVQHVDANTYLSSYKPRVPSLPHTAPIYDEVTKPTVAPIPAACIASHVRCQCYTQQGTMLDIAEPVCRDIVRKGFFVDWQQNVPVMQSGGVANG